MSSLVHLDTIRRNEEILSTGEVTLLSGDVDEEMTLLAKFIVPGLSFFTVPLKKMLTVRPSHGDRIWVRLTSTGTVDDSHITMTSFGLEALYIADELFFYSDTGEIFSNADWKIPGYYISGWESQLYVPALTVEEYKRPNALSLSKITDVIDEFALSMLFSMPKRKPRMLNLRKT